MQSPRLLGDVVRAVQPEPAMALHQQARVHHQVHQPAARLAVNHDVRDALAKPVASRTRSRVTIMHAVKFSMTAPYAKLH